MNSTIPSRALYRAAGERSDGGRDMRAGVYRMRRCTAMFSRFFNEMLRARAHESSFGAARPVMGDGKLWCPDASMYHGLPALEARVTGMRAESVVCGFEGDRRDAIKTSETNPDCALSVGQTNGYGETKATEVILASP